LAEWVGAMEKREEFVETKPVMFDLKEVVV
jgi:hypothetical protein